MKEPLMSGPFFIGCNYWASHAGTNMWHVWDADVVEEDFSRLAAADVRVLRVFPLWPDFQPLQLLCASGGAPREMRMGEEPLPDTPAGRAGVDETMCERFAQLCALAQQHGLRLIVGLLTGWMSGRLWVPRAFEGRNVLTDPLAISWELRFVRYFVSRFREEPAVAGWDLGNECNCMGRVETPAQAEMWTMAVADAIRAADPRGTSSGLRPVISGLHGLTPEGLWKPGPHGEAVDVLTPHPYAIFVPYCDTDPLVSYKASMQAAAQVTWYRGLGGKPAFAEEVGTLGPMMGGEREAAQYVNAVLWNLWAGGCHGFLWWCAAEQSHLTHAPYDWNSVERELGLFRLDGSPKPVARTLEAFAKAVQSMGALPERITDAVCVTTHSSDSWCAAWGSYLLARQAGLDIEFADGDRPLPESRAYILPGLSGSDSLSRRAWYALFDRVMEGATLFLTLDTALLSPFTEIAGVRVHSRARATGAVSVPLPDTRERLSLAASYVLKLVPTSAKVLLADAAGNPVMTENAYGKGRVVLLTLPAERKAASEPGVLEETPLYRLYRMAVSPSPLRAAVQEDPLITMTEHVRDTDTRVLTLVNPTDAPRRTEVRLSGTWMFGETGAETGAEPCVVRALSRGFSLTLGAGCGAAFIIRK